MKMDVVKAVRHNSFSSLVRFLVEHRRLRQASMGLIEKKARRIVVEENKDNRPVQVEEDKLAHLTSGEQQDNPREDPAAESLT